MQSSFFNFKLFSVSAVHGFCTSMVLFMLPLGKFWTWVLTGIRIRLDPELFPGSGMKHSGFTTLDASDHPTRFFNQCFWFTLWNDFANGLDLVSKDVRLKNWKTRLGSILLDRSIKFVPKQITFFESINRVKRYCSQLHTVEVPKLNLYVIHAKI